MPRRIDSFRAERYPLGHDNAGGQTATTILWAWKVPAGRTLTFNRAVVNVGTTMTANATDFWTFALKDGSTTIASWSTQTTGGGGQGTLTANTPADMTLNATQANLSAAGGDTLTLVATKTGSPSALPTFNINPDGYLL